MVGHRITQVAPNGIAAECGIQAGDVLLSINGEAVLDQIDYQFLTASKELVLEVQDKQGIVEIQLEKDEDEPLGLVFESTMITHPRSCANRCVFCFIDQMPPGLRDTLYVKDDDWRLSLLMGNYITLTNLGRKEFERIIARRASPLYISVHATNGAVRARMMGNSRASELLQQLGKLQDAGIAFHCQIVLCPGMNDGAVLDETLDTLSSLYPAARTAALVPVGLSRYRDGLPTLQPYDRNTARRLLDQAHGWQHKLLEKLGTRFLFPADEFYCLSGYPLPGDQAYEEYAQIENGVGLLRSFEKEYRTAYGEMVPEDTKPRRVLIATGVSAAPFFETLVSQFPIKGVSVVICGIVNRFFGETVTVAGLLTGQDFLFGISGRDKVDEVLISRASLRQEGDLFLDGMSLDALAERIGTPVHAVSCDGAAFLYALQGDYMED